jgi:hypothetical protein
VIVALLIVKSKMEIQKMTTSTIDLEYRLLPCGRRFVISLSGLPLCKTAVPIYDAALFLQEAGIPDETVIRFIREQSDLGITCSLRDAISTPFYEIYASGLDDCTRN